MAYLERYENQSTQIEINIEKETKITPVRMKSETKMELKAPPFGLYEITMFCPQDHTSMTESRQWHSGTHAGINCNSFNHQSVFSETIRGGNGHRCGESSVVVVQKEKPAFVTPEWMEERQSPETKRRNPEDLDINVLLKYPNSYVPKRNAPDPSKVQYESTIRPEVAKRDKSVPVLQDLEDDDDKDDEYDEFEEVIVIVNVQRKPVWHSGLELPKSEPRKVGVPIQDLLQLPTRRAKLESAQDKLYIDNNSNGITIIEEKVECVGRPAVVQEAQALASIFQGRRFINGRGSLRAPNK